MTTPERRNDGVIHRHAKQCVLIRARLRSFWRMDTRIYELYSLASSLMWAIGFATLRSYTAQSSFGRVEDYLPPYIGFVIIFPVALTHLAAILLNKGRVRRACILLGVAWWTWLAFLMFQFPPNNSASITYGLMAAFGVWSYVAARMRGEVR
jgi:hypothetical protein